MRIWILIKIIWIRNYKNKLHPLVVGFETGLYPNPSWIWILIKIIWIPYYKKNKLHPHPYF